MQRSNQRFLTTFADGSAVETVWYPTGTLCLSTQVGCPMGCPFCASGRGRWRRNLTTEELAAQLEQARSQGLEPRRITLSGVGDPLLNPAVVGRFIETCPLPVSLTTTAPDLERLPAFLRAPHNGLMLSLHAGTAATHRRLVPKGPHWEGLWRVLDENLPRLSRRRRRKVGINYLVLAGINDGAAELSRLVERLRPHGDLTLHLLSCNPVPGSPYASPGPEHLEAIHRRLSAAGVAVRRANRWRRLADGGCGTLVARQLERRGAGGESVFVLD